MSFKHNKFIFFVSVLLALTNLRGALANSQADLSSMLGLPFVKVYDPSKIEPANWVVEDPTNEIRMWSYHGIALIEAVRSSQSWSTLYKSVSVDLNKHPFLQINVLSATKKWFLILSSPKLKNDYIRLIETDQAGLFTFDVPKLTGLDGRQKLIVKIGISDPSAFSLSNEKMAFNQLVFIEQLPLSNSKKSFQKNKKIKKYKKNSKEIALFIPDSSGIDAWNTAPKDGPREVHYSVKEGRGIIQGRMNARNWGSLHREISVDLNKFPSLEINVVSSSKNWYLILSNPKLKNGYIRLIETHKSGLFKFDLPKLTQLKGKQKLEIKLGVSHPENSSIKGDWMVFDQFRFKKL